MKVKPPKFSLQDKKSSDISSYCALEVEAQKFDGLIIIVVVFSEYAEPFQ